MKEIGTGKDNKKTSLPQILLDTVQQVDMWKEAGKQTDFLSVLIKWRTGESRGSLK